VKVLITWLAMAAPAGGEGGDANPILTFLPFILMIVVVWFLLIRPQRKRQKEQKEMLNALSKGDRVITTSGIIGTVFGINEKDNIIVLKVGEDTKIEFLRSSVSGKLSP
jgi:preprotein translocase subunit YajC